MIANYAAIDVTQGSTGKSFPGIEASTVRKTGDGKIEAVEGPRVQ
jgi:hypothetical protein